MGNRKLGNEKMRMYEKGNMTLASETNMETRNRYLVTEKLATANLSLGKEEYLLWAVFTL